MAYKPTLINAVNVPGGCEVTVLGVDDAGVYPDIRETYKLRGVDKSELTLQMMLPYLRKTAATQIQRTIVANANAQLDALCSARWQANNVPATLATYAADVQARLAAKNIDNTTVSNYIVAQWQAYGVNVLNTPRVSISVVVPTGPTDSVVATN